MSTPKSDKRRREQAKKRAAKKAAMARPGARSKYARKLAGELPERSPYRNRWIDYAPLGVSARAAKKAIDAACRRQAGTD
jgi:hypothetical protein